MPVGIPGVPAATRTAENAGTGEGNAAEAGVPETDAADESYAVRLPTGTCKCIYNTHKYKCQNNIGKYIYAEWYR